MPLAPRCCLLLVAIAAGAAAQEEQPISWAYGSYFGTGYYELATGEETYVISARPGWGWRDAELRDDGRRIGVQFRVPIAVGIYSLDPGDLVEDGRDNALDIALVEMRVELGQPED